MIFTGRLLASANALTIWEKPRGEGFSLHFMTRGLILDLSEAELASLAAVSANAMSAAQTPEDEKDHLRRLQILQARLNDFLKRERNPAG
ncbi:MAG TPA: hypothetical protein VMW65_12555 [Chloroflexota bacterium]|nr:hypothetical protein [Chloroflexota bacterium]